MSYSNVAKNLIEKGRNEKTPLMPKWYTRGRKNGNMTILVYKNYFLNSFLKIPPPT